MDNSHKITMKDKPTYQELEYRLKFLENEARWRKQAEDALKESEERFRLLFEYAPDMYILFDSKGFLIDANRAAEKLTGYERHEVIGKNLFSFGIITENQVQKAAELLYKISRKIPTNPEKIVILKKDGQPVHVELRAYPIELGGRPVVLTTARDISNYKETMEILKNREEKYRKLFETAPAPLLIFDVQTSRIDDANHAARVLFGYSREELIDKRFKDLLDDSADRVRLPAIKNGKLEGLAEISCLFRNKSGASASRKMRFRVVLIGGRQLLVGRIHAEALHRP
ncbi:MAG: PAS domain S-box protein [Proteobacteria bacterium]|nr:PAS domain S-box protein [Pseudomonadota bacterium]